MLVLGSLRPRGDEVGELEPTRGRPALDDETVWPSNFFPHHLAALEILSNVVEVKVDGWHVAPRCPLLVRSIEGDLGFRAVQRLTFYQGAKRLIHVLDHRDQPASKLRLEQAA